MIRSYLIKLNDVFPVWMIFLSLFRFFSQSEADRTSISYAGCLLLLCAVMALDEIMVGKGIRILHYIGINAFLCVAGGLASPVFLRFRDGARGTGLMRGFFIIITTGILIYAARHAAEKPRQSRTAILFDFSFAWLLLVIFVTTVMERSVYSPLVLWNGISCAGLLLSLLIYRTGTGDGSAFSGDLKGFFMPGMLCVLFGMVSVFTAGQSSRIAAGVRAVISVMKRAVDIASAFLTRLLMKIAAWLDSLFSPVKVTEEAPFDVVIPGIAEETVQEEAANPLIGWIAVGFLAVLLAWLVITLLLSLRGRRFAFRLGKKSRFVRRESHPLRELAEFLRKIASALRFEKEYLLHRRSPAGLYVYTRRRLKLRKSRQKKGESPCGFLRRLAETAGTSSSVYGDLAASLEEQFYGNGKMALPAGFAGRYLGQFSADRRAGRF